MADAPLGLYTCGRPALSMQAQLFGQWLRIPSDLDAASAAPGANLTHRLWWPQALMNFTGAGVVRMGTGCAAGEPQSTYKVLRD